jgi:hypothetical protein
VSDIIDLTGQRFGAWTVLSRAPNLGRYVAFNCRCDCGNERVVRGYFLRRGWTTRCKSCHARDMAAETVATGRRTKVKVGARYGRLEVLRRSGRSSENGQAYWLCRCDCGTEKEITSSNLVAGDMKSCGCWRRERIVSLNVARAGRGRKAS